MCVYGVVLINILVLQLGPPKQKFLAPPLIIMIIFINIRYLLTIFMSFYTLVWDFHLKFWKKIGLYPL